MNDDLNATPQSVTATAGGITMQIDLHQMLTAIDPAGRWIGYDPDSDDDRYEPSSLALQIADLTADRLTRAMRAEVKDMVENQVSDVIRAEVTQVVRDYLTGTAQKTDEFGEPVGKPVPLTKMIVDAATAMNKPVGFSSPETPMSKLVKEAVGTAFKNELAAAVKDVRTQALAAVQNNAAQVIRETIERSARGLV